MLKILCRSAACAALLAGAALPASAAVGPDYKGPPAAAPVSTAAGRFHRAADAHAVTAQPPARWWDGLNEPLLARLVDEALADSPTVREAEAKVRAARARLGESKANRLPSGGVAARELSARLPGALGGQGGSTTDLNLYSAGFDASWELDLFGGKRRAIEEAGARAQAQAAELADAQVQLAAEVGQAYVGLRETQTRLALARDAVDLQRQLLDLTRQRQAQGAAADGDVERVQTGLEQAEAEVAPLEGQVDQFRDQLAVLTGREPGALDAELAAAAAVPTPPAATPVGDPAELLRRRPDIRAAERQLAASNAVIGEHVADFFPKVTLKGDIGLSGASIGHGFGPGQFSAFGGPSLSWSLFDFPRIRAEVRGAKADRDAAAAEYQKVVLAALQDAEGSLSRYGAQSRSLVSLVRAEASATRASDITRRRYQAGTASLIDALDAQRQQIQARNARAEGQGELTNDYIALQKSLGLGWGQLSDKQIRVAK
jgi:NodT family efflux transporter outer membrane factor (OMF) lipoprotein